MGYAIPVPAAVVIVAVHDEAVFGAGHGDEPGAASGLWVPQDGGEHLTGDVFEDHYRVGFAAFGLVVGGDLYPVRLVAGLHAGLGEGKALRAMDEEVIYGAGSKEGLEAGGEAGVLDGKARHAYVIGAGDPGFDLFGHLMGFRPPLLGEGDEFFAVEGGLGKEA